MGEGGCTGLRIIPKKTVFLMLPLPDFPHETSQVLRTNEQPCQDFNTIFFGIAHIAASLSLSHGHQGHHSYDNHQGQYGHHG